MKIFNEQFSKTSSKLNEDHTILSLADIHINDGLSYKLMDNTLEEISATNPDTITVSGDWLYNADEYLVTRNREKLYYFIKRLTKIATVITSLGNHDLYDGRTAKASDTKELLRYLEKLFDFILLDNENITINDINYICFSPRIKTYEWQYKKYWNQWFCEDLIASNLRVIKDKFNLLLLHSPLALDDPELVSMLNEYFDYIDLTISGHMHDGLIPRWMQNTGLVKGEYGIETSIYKLWAPKCRGEFNIGNGTLIVNRGLRKWVMSNKLFDFADKFWAKDIATIKLIKERNSYER